MHLDALLFISNQLFGQDYYSAEEFRQSNQSDILRLVMSDGELVGFFIFKITSEHSVEYAEGNSDARLLEVKTIAVHAAHQGKGIGSIIFNEVTNIAKEFGAECCYCVAWKRNGNVAMHNIHINAGFKVLREIEHFWQADSIEKGYDCPECGNPCNCSAVIYSKEC